VKEITNDNKGIRRLDTINIQVRGIIYLFGISKEGI
jgi:hypothetical protein